MRFNIKTCSSLMVISLMFNLNKLISGGTNFKTVITYPFRFQISYVNYLQSEKELVTYDSTHLSLRFIGLIFTNQTKHCAQEMVIHRFTTLSIYESRIVHHPQGKSKNYHKTYCTAPVHMCNASLAVYVFWSLISNKYCLNQP